MTETAAHIRNKPQKNEFGMWCVDIESSKYEFEQWGAEEASDILADLLILVGEPLAQAAASMSAAKGLDTEVTPNLAALVIGSLMKNLRQDKDKVLGILKKLSGKGVMCDGKQVNFNDFYRGKFALMAKVAAAGFEVQFGNFSDAVLTPLGFSMKTKDRTAQFKKES